MEATQGLEIPVIGGRGRYSGGTKKYSLNWTGRSQRYGNAATSSLLCPITKNAGCGAKKNYSTLTLVMFNVWAINHKTPVRQDYFAEQDVDLACVTETLVRASETVALNLRVQFGCSVFYQFQENALSVPNPGLLSYNVNQPWKKVDSEISLHSQYKKTHQT